MNIRMRIYPNHAQSLIRVRAFNSGDSSRGRSVITCKYNRKFFGSDCFGNLLLNGIKHFGVTVNAFCKIKICRMIQKIIGNRNSRNLKITEISILKTSCSSKNSIRATRSTSRTGCYFRRIDNVFVVSTHKKDSICLC